MLADCVGNVVSVTPYSDVPASKETIGCLTVLSGAGMPVYSSVKKAAAWYPSTVQSISYE